MLIEMKNRLPNYVRAHRRRAGLSQYEIATILGYRDEGTVSRHELFRSVPPLLIALAYEIIFREPVSELFAGLRDSVEEGIEKRIGELESRLLEQSGDGVATAAPAVTHKLGWIRERRGTCR